MTELTVERRIKRTAAAGAITAMFVAALNLRPAIAAVAPLVDTIRADLGLSATGVALLTTVPTLAMGLCAPLAAALGHRRGPHAGVLAGLAVVALATLARGVGGAAWWQLVSAFAAGAGIAVVQTLLPALVKARFADRAGLVTGIYTAGLGLGAAVAAGATGWLAGALGSWPLALASWAVLAGVAVVCWLSAGRSLRAVAVAVRGPVTGRLPWRDPVVWRITAIAAGNSALYYCELAWIGPLLTGDVHLAPTTAGLYLTAMIVVQVVAMLAVPVLVGRWSDRRAGLALTAVLVAAGFAGLAAAPGTAVWLWLLLIGVGHGGLFPLTLALPVTLSRDPGHAGQVSGMAFFVGYACAAVLPVLIGLLRDATDGFALAFAVLTALTALLLWPIARLPR